MRTQFITIKQIKTPIKISKRFYMFDVGFIIIFTAVFSQFSSLVHEWLYYPFMINCVCWGIFLTKPSPYNEEKRTWQSLLYYLIKRKVHYTSKQHRKPLPKGESTL